jgi:hypothetical protein
MPRRQIGGYVSIKKTAGQTGGIYLASGAQIDIPVVMAEPVNPLNILRRETINRLSTLNQRMIAKRTPAARMVADMKSWASASLMADWLLSADANGNSSEFTLLFNDGSSSLSLSDRQFQGAKLVNLAIAGSGVDPSIRMVMDYVAIKADSDVSSPTSFSAFTSDYGQTYGAQHINWGASATATDVNAWSINLSRIQIPQFFSDGQLFASRITSGPVRGSVLLQQDPDATTVPTTGLTVRYGSGSGAALSLVLDGDNVVYPLEAGPGVLGNVSRFYTLADSVSAAGVVLAVASW